MKKKLASILLFLTFNLYVAAVTRTDSFIIDAPQELRVETKIEKIKNKILSDWSIEVSWKPCPIKVEIADTPSGLTHLNYKTNEHNILVRGPPDQIDSVIAHEVTHAIMGSLFRKPLPRWADEGMAILSEFPATRIRHDKMCRDILNKDRRIPLSRLIKMMDYSRDPMLVYAQGYSLTDYLVKRKDRISFLKFLGDGIHKDWDQAVNNYEFDTIDAMEEAWLKHLRDTKGKPHIANSSKD